MDAAAFKAKYHISGAVLKWIAIITMFIDHSAVTIMERFLRVPNWTLSMDRHDFYKYYQFLRGVGRLGFPLFCFLLVEGLTYTKNRSKYAIRLFIFCFLSEVPFDIALFNSWITWEHQNVFMTLLIGYLVIWVMDELLSHMNNAYLALAISVPIVAAAYYLANYMHTDYRGYGVLAIVAMYLFRFDHSLSLTAGIIILSLFNEAELPAFFALIPMFFYDGSRGKQMKYFFYFFYPVHLMLLYGVWVFFFAK